MLCYGRGGQGVRSNGGRFFRPAFFLLGEGGRGINNALAFLSEASRMLNGFITSLEK